MTELKERFENADSDSDRWSLVRCNYEDFKIIVDNDETYAELVDGGEWLKFANSIGCMDGVFELLESMCIDADYV